MRKVNYDEFQEVVIKEKKTCVIDFFATWCGPCRMLAPTLEEVSKLNEFNDIEFIKVDCDEERQLAYEYAISNIPTLLFIKEGKVVSKNMGFVPKDDLIEWINNSK